MHEAHHDVISQVRLYSQQFVGGHGARDEHVLNISDRQASKLVEIEQFEDEFDFVLEGDKFREECHGWKELQSIDEKVVRGVEKIEDRVRMAKDFLEFHIVNGSKSVTSAPVRHIEFLDLRQ